MQVDIPYVLVASRFATVPAGLIPPTPRKDASETPSKSTETANAK